MEWKTPLVILRPKVEGVVTVVHEASSLKDSRYWLNYIAEPFDALHLTPLNPKYNGSGEPTYSCHLVSRAKTDYNEGAWKSRVFGSSEIRPLEIVYFEKQEEAAAPAQQQRLSETEIIQIANGLPQTLSLEKLQSLVTQNKMVLKVVLADATKWIDWESALTLMTKEVHVIGVNPADKWPITVTLEPKSGKGETMNFDSKMKFIVRM